MKPNTNTRNPWIVIALFTLYFITIGLGLQAISDLKDLYILVFVALGGGAKQAEVFVPYVMLVLAIGFIFVAIGTFEYHRSHVGEMGSWRLFALTIAVEVLILLVYFAA